jgi:tetratricopeptide (TPR) repeat protein
MAYSEARLSSESMTPAALASSVEQLHGVIKTDPFFAPAYHDLAVNLVTMGFWGHLPPARAYSDAEEAASLGLALDDSLSEGHVALAYVRWLNDWDSAAAEREFRHAVSLNPSSASAHLSYALFLAAVRRNSTHAIQQVTATLRMDPLSPMTAALCGWIFLFVGDLDGASRQAMRALALHPDALHAHYVLGWVAGRRDDWPGAVEHFEEALAVSRESHSLAYLGHALARGGRRDDAVALLNELKTRRQHERVSPYCFAVWHAGAGETDEAFAYLEQCYEHRESRIFWLPVTPASDLLRGDPRFDAFLERLGVAVPD